MPFKHWKSLGLALLTFTSPLLAHAESRPAHPTVIIDMDTNASYVAKGPSNQAELRRAVLLQLSNPHACGSDEVYLTPESVGVPNESFGRLINEVQQLIDDETPLLLTLSDCDGQRAFFEKVRACTPEECAELTATLVDGKQYLDEQYQPIGRSQASFFIPMPMPYDKKLKAWHAKVFYVESKTLRRDYFVDAKDFVSGKPVYGSKTYYPNGKLGQSFQNDVHGKRQGEVVTYSETGIVTKRATYLNDELEGLQTTYHDNGKIEEAYTLHNGKRVDGESLTYDEDGKLAERTLYRNGVFDGPYTAYYPSGKLRHSSTFVAGDGQGPSISYFEDGSVQTERNDVDGHPDGWLITYYASGKVAEKEFYEHEKQRSLARWNEQGVQTLQSQWDEQRREQGDFKRWYGNGQLKEHTTYKDGKIIGEASSWFENGQLKEQITYKDGERQGETRNWYESGQLNSSVHYVDSQRDGKTQYWDMEGKLSSECTYKAGERIGDCTQF